MRAELAEQRDLIQRAAELGGKVPPLEASDSAASENDPLIGKVLGDRYYVRRRIGEGAMGRVYEGHHTGIGKRVAIKIPRHVERRSVNWPAAFSARRLPRRRLAIPTWWMSPIAGRLKTATSSLSWSLSTASTWRRW